MTEKTLVAPEGNPGPFIGAPLVSDPEKIGADFAVVGVPFGVPYVMRHVHGDASNGPRAVRAASIKFARMKGNHDFDLGCTFDELNVDLVDYGDIAGNPLDIVGNSKRVTAEIGKLAARGVVPIVLGGDDSITALAIAGLQARGPVTIVQIDAHLDYRDEVNGVRDGYSSAMRRAAEMPWVERIVHVGTRGVGSARPSDVADTLARGNRIVSAREIRTSGIEAVIAHVAAGSNVYIALDCDGLDPSVMPGTGAPVPGGLSYFEAVELITSLGRHSNVIGFNCTELYPSLDVNGITALTLTRLIVSLIASTRTPLR